MHKDDEKKLITRMYKINDKRIMQNDLLIWLKKMFQKNIFSRNFKGVY